MALACCWFALVLALMTVRCATTSRPAPPKAALTILVSIDGFRVALSFGAVWSKIVVA